MKNLGSSVRVQIDVDSMLAVTGGKTCEERNAVNYH